MGDWRQGGRAGVDDNDSNDNPVRTYTTHHFKSKPSSAKVREQHEPQQLLPLSCWEPRRCHCPVVARRPGWPEVVVVVQYQQEQ